MPREAMNEEISLSKYLIGLRLLGHDFEAIALAFVDGAVEALAAGGYRGPVLDRALRMMAEEMRKHAVELVNDSATTPPPGSPPTLRSQLLIEHK